MISQESKDTILEVQVTAGLQGHDLGPFEPVDPDICEWQAGCRNAVRAYGLGRMG